jgi:hypothetical protein
MRRWSAIAGFALLVVAAAGWSAFWFKAAGEAGPRVAAWAAQQRAEGLVAEYGAVEVGGFPLRWRVRIESPRMAGAGSTQWEWRGSAIVLDLRPWATRDISFLLPGEHQLSAGAGESRRVLMVAARRPEGGVLLDVEGKLARLTLDLGEVELSEPPAIEKSRIARAQITLSPHRAPEATYRTDTLDSMIRLEELVLATPPRTGLGPRVVLAELNTSFKGRLPPGPLAKSVDAWRDDGGTIEINRLTLLWGPLDLDGSGTLALDPANRLLGAFTARLRGYAETMDAFASAGLVRPRDAAGVKIALNLFARQGQNGKPNELVVPLTAQDGRLAVGGFNLFRLDPLRFE